MNPIPFQLHQSPLLSLSPVADFNLGLEGGHTPTPMIIMIIALHTITITITITITTYSYYTSDLKKRPSLLLSN